MTGSHSRPYRSDDDLRVLQRLVSDAWADDRPFVRLHPGDLAWWRFQHDLPGWEERVRIWVDASHRPVAFGWRTPPGSLEQFVARTARGNQELLAEILAWHEEATPLGERVEVWAMDLDLPAHEALARRGYRLGDDHVYRHFFRALREPMPETPVPAGYRVASMAETTDVAARVAVHRAAFAPSRVTMTSYARVTAAPLYRADLDIVTIAPDGSFAASALGWFDPGSRSVELEPVATHPDHRRLGLARAACAAVLRRAHAHGATDGVVYGVAGAPAVELYQSLGFRHVGRNEPWRRPPDPVAEVRSG